MSLIELIILLLIAGICGAIARSLVGYTRGGCFISIIVGFIGALIGTWLARKASLPDFFVINVGSKTFPVIWSIIGAAIFAGVISFLTPKK